MKSLKYSSLSRIKKQKQEQKNQSSILNTLKQDDQICSNLLDTLSDDYLGYLEDLMGKKIVQELKSQRSTKQSPKQIIVNKQVIKEDKQIQNQSIHVLKSQKHQNIYQNGEIQQQQQIKKKKQPENAKIDLANINTENNITIQKVQRIHFDKNFIPTNQNDKKVQTNRRQDKSQKNKINSNKGDQKINSKQHLNQKGNHNKKQSHIKNINGNKVNKNSDKYLIKNIEGYLRSLNSISEKKMPYKNNEQILWDKYANSDSKKLNILKTEQHINKMINKQKKEQEKHKDGTQSNNNKQNPQNFSKTIAKFTSNINKQINDQQQSQNEQKYSSMNDNNNQNMHQPQYHQQTKTNYNSLQELLIKIITKYNKLQSKHYKCKQKISFLQDQCARLQKLNQFKDFQIDILKTQKMTTKNNGKQNFIVSNQSHQNKLIGMNKHKNKQKYQDEICSATENEEDNKYMKTDKYYNDDGYKNNFKQNNNLKQKKMRQKSGKTINIQKMFVIDNLSLKKQNNDKQKLNIQQFNNNNHNHKNNNNKSIDIENKYKQKRSVSCRQNNTKKQGLFSHYLYSTLNQQQKPQQMTTQLQNRKRAISHQDQNLSKNKFTYSTTLPNHKKQLLNKQNNKIHQKFIYQQNRTYEGQYRKEYKRQYGMQYDQIEYDTFTKQVTKRKPNTPKLNNDEDEYYMQQKQLKFKKQNKKLSKTIDLKDNSFGESYNSALSIKRRQSLSGIKHPKQTNYHQAKYSQNNFFKHLNRFNQQGQQQNQSEDMQSSSSEQENQQSIKQTNHYFTNFIQKPSSSSQSFNKIKKYNNYNQFESTDSQLLQKLLQIKNSNQNHIKNNNKNKNVKSFFK